MFRDFISFWNIRRKYIGYIFTIFIIYSSHQNIVWHTNIKTIFVIIMFPFGKYKGQQISEVFKRDKKYVDWLVTTEWFTTRFIDLCKLSNHLISEHNRNIVYNDFITIYTDGACSRNGMEGAQCGIGIYFSERNPVHIDDVSERLKVDKPTNNVAELTAIKRSLDILIEKQINRLQY